MFQGDGNPNDKKKSMTNYDKPFEREPKTYQNYPPKDITQMPIVPNMPPYTGMYHQPQTPMQYPGYGIPQNNQPPLSYPPSDMYYMPNTYYPNNGK